MKFKGFWTRIVELQKESNRFLKDYWLAYILLVMVFCVPYWCFLAYRSYSEVKSDFNRVINEEKN